MTDICAAQADRLEALISTIENATELHGRLVTRNAEAWIESAKTCLVATPTIDEAANRAVRDASLFGARLQPEAAGTEQDAETLRAAAVASVRGLQSVILNATANATARTMAV